MTFDQPSALLAVFLALALGGLLKGATGAGAPVIAVPVIAAFFDVRIAVAIMAIPNLITNLWQIRQFRSNQMQGRFSPVFAFAGGIGAVIGTAMLAWLPVSLLSGLIVVVIVVYIALRLSRPEFAISKASANRAVVPTGLIAGVLQGATGISAPVSVTFLNAMRLPRATFIATISLFFAVMSIAQLPTLYANDLLSVETVAVSVVSLVPLFVFMRFGEMLGSRLPAITFDRIVLILLAVLAIRLLWTALT